MMIKVGKDKLGVVSKVKKRNLRSCEMEVKETRGKKSRDVARF